MYEKNKIKTRRTTFWMCKFWMWILNLYEIWFLKFYDRKFWNMNFGILRPEILRPRCGKSHENHKNDENRIAFSIFLQEFWIYFLFLNFFVNSLIAMVPPPSVSKAMKARLTSSQSSMAMTSKNQDFCRKFMQKIDFVERNMQIYIKILNKNQF